MGKILEELKALPRGTVRYCDLKNLSYSAFRKVYEAGKYLGDDATYAEWVEFAILDLDED